MSDEIEPYVNPDDTPSDNPPELSDDYQDMFADIQASLSDWTTLQGFEQAYEVSQMTETLSSAVHNLNDLFSLCMRQTPETEEQAYQSFYLATELCNTIPVALATLVEMKRTLNARRSGKA